MNPLFNPLPYPVNAFYSMIPSALWEVQCNLQVDGVLAATAFLTSLSIACQGDIVVELPSGRKRPVSLKLAIFSDSGEGKTAVYDHVGKAIVDHDAQLLKSLEVSEEAYKNDLNVWKTVDTALRKKLSKAVQRGNLVDEIKGELLAHGLQKPVKPHQRRIIFQDVTGRPIMMALHGEAQSIAIMSDEGEIVLKGGAMDSMSLLSKAWDGAEILALDRADESFIATNPRVTVSYMVQQGIFADFMKKRGDIARTSGHLARYLVAQPFSVIGFRTSNQAESQWIHLPQFHARVTELLTATEERHAIGDYTFKVLTMSPEAKAIWAQAQNNLESYLRPGEQYRSIRDFASKSLDIAARIAAIFHHFHGLEGEINANTMQRALDIVHWHLLEFYRLFGERPPRPQFVDDAMALSKYMHDHHWILGEQEVFRNDVRKNGPIRNQPRFEAALSHLLWMKAITIPPLENGKGKVVIQLRQEHFEPLPQPQEVHA